MDAQIGFRILSAEDACSEMMCGLGEHVDWPECDDGEATATGCAERVALWAISSSRHNLWARWFGLSPTARVVVHITAETACAGLYAVRLRRSLKAAARRLA